jgi:amidase
MRSVRYPSPLAALSLLLCVMMPTLPALAQTNDSPMSIPQVDRLRPLDLTSFEDAIAALSPARAAEIEALVLTHDLAALQDMLWNGTLTSVELTTFYLSRIARHDDTLRALLELNPAALEEARAADAAFLEGNVASLLQGIPVAIKDNIETAGPMHTTANAAILLGNVAATDAPLVARLRAAGAVILGKTSLSEFAGVMSLGVPRGGSGAVGGQAMNPYGPFPTSGSSSGSAIAVAALLTHLSVGTETSGSLIAPGTDNGIVALKPTHGSIPGDGIIPLLSGNDTPGPMGRSVVDVMALHAVLSGAADDTFPEPDPTALDGVQVGLLAAGIASNDPAGEILPRITTALTTLGAQIIPADLTDPTGQIDAFTVLIGSGIRHEMMPYITARHPDIATPEDLIAWNAADPATRAPFGQDLLTPLSQMSTQITAADHAAFSADLHDAATDALTATFNATGAEILISTSSTHAPFYATAGWPAVTVPLGLASGGHPIGITLIGQAGQDTQLLVYAAAIEAVTAARVLPDLYRTCPPPCRTPQGALPRKARTSAANSARLAVRR